MVTGAPSMTKPTVIITSEALQRVILTSTLLSLVGGFVVDRLRAQDNQAVTNERLLMAQQYHEQRISKLENRFDWILFGIVGIVGSNVIGLVVKKKP